MKTKEIDMVNGSLLPKIVTFSLTIFITNILQLLFNTSDLIVVGKFAGNDCLGAVGATTALLNVFLYLFMGFSIGVSVVCTHTYGSGDKKGFRETVTTAVSLSAVGGVVLTVLGFFFSEYCLELMGTPDKLLPLAATYLKIYFFAMPAIMFYNYAAAVLRSVGNTKTPMLALSVSGGVNVVLNLMFVILFGMDVDGVALASVISQYISAFMILLHMIRTDSEYNIRSYRFSFNAEKLKKILYIGIPNGAYCTIISLSNVFIQSSVNSLGSAVVTGSAAASNIESYVYQIQVGFHNSAMVFTGQNFGAGKYERIRTVQKICYSGAIIGSLVLGAAVYFAGHPLLGIFLQKDSQTADAVAAGMDRILMICVPYFICGMIEVMTGVLSGLGQSVAPSVVSAPAFAECALFGF